MDGALLPLLDKLKTEPGVSKDAVVAQSDVRHRNALSLYSEWDVPLDIVKEETDSVDIDEAAIEQYCAEPKHSALGLHSEYEIKSVKEEPDDVDTVASGKPESHAISYVPSASLPLLTTPPQKNRRRTSACPRLAVTSLRRRSMLKTWRNWRFTSYERVADILAAGERRRLESEEARDRRRLEFEEARETREMDRFNQEKAREKREIERLRQEEAREKREMERLSREEAREKREMERLSREEARDKRLHEQEMKMLREQTALLQRLNDIGQRLLDVLNQQRPVGSLPSWL